MIKIFSYTKNKLEEIKPEELKKNSKTTYWIALENSNTNEIKSIKKIFEIHPTTTEDILSNQTRIKYEEFEENTTIIFHGIKRLEVLGIKTYNLSFVFGENYLITSNSEKNENIDYLLNNQKKLESLMKKGKGYIMHYILDKEMDKCTQIKANMFEEFKELEKNFIRNPEKEVLEELFEKELTILETRQLMESLTDLCLSLTKPTDNYLENDLLPYFRDIYDHAFKTTESLKGMLGRINGMRNAYQSITSNRLNETMKVLTILMAIMMPLTVITGFFGMNVKIPLEEHPDAYLFILGLMILSGAFLVWISRTKGWMSKK